VENEALTELKAALELEAFKYLQELGRHRLPYQEYLRAKELGIELPEAEPCFRTGLLHGDMLPEPIEVTMPKGHTLGQCYRLAQSEDGHESDEANAHLLAALGRFDSPFVPVEIRSEYDGYAWAKLPTIGRVELAAGKLLTEIVAGANPVRRFIGDHRSLQRMAGVSRRARFRQQLSRRQLHPADGGQFRPMHSRRTRCGSPPARTENRIDPARPEGGALASSLS